MIKLQDLTPEVYYRQSRDFQFIGRLFDLVLNSVKTNAANLYNLPVGKEMDEQLLNLLALTLGFKTTKNYNSKQLLAICSTLPAILKHKGSIKALVLAVDALLAAEGIKQPLDYTISAVEGITLYVAQELEDTTLLTDLFDYLLPAGISCELVKESQLVSGLETKFTFTDQVNVYKKDETQLSVIASKSNLDSLVLGDIGDNASILANTTIIKKQPKETIATTPEEEN
jgi:hypothetical protein